jgi:hypothetical protein
VYTGTIIDPPETTFSEFADDISSDEMSFDEVGMYGEDSTLEPVSDVSDDEGEEGDIDPASGATVRSFLI